MNAGALLPVNPPLADQQLDAEGFPEWVGMLALVAVVIGLVYGSDWMRRMR